MAINFANNSSLANITSLPASISGGGLTLVSSQTASASASLEFSMDSTYDSYVFKYINIHGSTATSNFVFQTSTNGGSSYSVSKTHVHLQAGVNAGSYFGLTVDTGQSFEDGTGQATLVAGVDTALNTDRLITGTFFAYQSSATSYGKNYKGEFIYDASGTVKAKMQFPFGIMQTTSAITAYKFWMNTGTITGTIRLYGVTV